MATLSVLKFPNPEGADKTLSILEKLTKQHLIKIHDAAVVSWPKGKKKPRTRQLSNLAGRGALSGAFWGMLFGLIFFVPLFGMAVGAAIGGLLGSMSNVGIDKDFISKVRRSVTEGTSALFLLSTEATLDKVAQALKGVKFELLQTNLSKEQEAKLHEAFGLED